MTLPQNCEKQSLYGHNPSPTHTIYFHKIHLNVILTNSI